MLLFIGLIHLGFLYNHAYTGLRNPGREFTVLYEWSQLEFDYPSPYERQLDIDLGNFIPGKPAPIDTDMYYSDFGINKIFITIPRLQSGVPVTLGTVKKTFNGNPVISPYPSWSWQKDIHKCKKNRIVSVYRVAIDECGRLWVLDTGKLVDKIICPPQILIFDLETDQLIHSYDIPFDQLESRSILVTPVVEVLDKNFQCQDTFVYLADCRTYSIIVYDLRRDTSWRVTDKTMYPFPEFGTFRIQGESFELMDGILGMSLSPVNDRRRKLFYHALASPTENWIYTSHLRNRSLVTNNPPPTLFNTLPGKRHTQAAAEAIDRNGVMYFGLVSDVQIACYNTRAGDYGSWKSSDIISDNPVTLQFASGVKVITNKKFEEEVWIVTSRFQKVANGNLNPNEINFRIQVAKASELIAGTQCMRGDILLSPQSPHVDIVPQLQHSGGYGHYHYGK